MKTYFSTVYYIFFYSLVLAISFSVSLIFAPFTFIDNDHSYIRCFKDGRKYETSPNYIFALDTKLDSFNDIKARKLCEHQIIRDYINSYPTPPVLNYEFLPAKAEDSSWMNVFFVFLLSFFAGTALIELSGRLLKYKINPFKQIAPSFFQEFSRFMQVKNILLVFITILLAGFFYRFILQKESLELYCRKQTDLKLYKFRQAVTKNGADKKLEENEEVKKFITGLFNGCLR